METGYKKLVYFFSLLAIMTLIGFYKNYFARFPDFNGLLNIHHFHAVVLVCWLSLLIIQPLLIINKKFRIHRMLGTFSYFLVPVIFISMLLVYHNQYLRLVSEGKSESETLAFVFSPASDAIPFIILYLLAILNKNDQAKHMRYIISTGIIIGGPGLGRIFMNYFGMDIFTAIGLISLISLLVFVSLILYDRIQKKTFKTNPFTIAFSIWLIPNILIIFFPQTPFWQSCAKFIVELV